MRIDDTYRCELRKTVVVAVALLVVAPVVYLLVAAMVQWRPETRGGGETTMLFYILLIVGLVQPVAGIFIERRQITNYRLARGSRMTPWQLFTSVSVIKYAFVAAVYVYGLVVRIVTGEVTWMLWFYPVGIMWSALYWPRHSSCERFMAVLEAGDAR